MDSPGQMTCWIGYDSREVAAFAVARYSVARFNRYLPIKGLVLSDLQARGIYNRPTEFKIDADGKRRVIDVLSKRDDYDGSISTEFAVSRFFVPLLARSGWALFMDSDVIVRDNITKLYECGQRDKALMCVKHDYTPRDRVKMDGQLQTAYPRKNWSSVMLFNCNHPANRRLTFERVNSVPSLQLHQLCWLEDDEIGELPPEWNYLVGESQLNTRPALVHFTRGLPDMHGYERQEYADEWRQLQPFAVGAL